MREFIMRRFSFALLLLAISQSSAQQPPGTRQASEQDPLQGVWIVTGLETGGKAESGPYRGSFLFLKDKAILREGTQGTYQPIDYAYTLDSSKKPKSIDLTIKNKDGVAVEIRSTPRDGTNPDLIAVGATYGVIHFKDEIGRAHV